VNLIQHILISGLRLYRWVSPAKTFLIGPLGHCRFTPSCSAYALAAIARHGAWTGTWLALKRVARCHPWGGCGEDPVPERVVRMLSSPPAARARENQWAEGH
jgi:putative membrane protein insertion efficiency factor